MLEVFGRSVNPIPARAGRGADYVHHITTGPSDFGTMRHLWFPSVNSCCCIYYIKVELLWQLCEMFYIFDLQKRIIVATIICRTTIFVIICKYFLVLHQMIRPKGILGKTPSVSMSLFLYLICFRPSSQSILHKHFFSINEVKSTIKKETNIKLLYPIA